MPRVKSCRRPLVLSSQHKLTKRLMETLLLCMCWRKCLQGTELMIPQCLKGTYYENNTFPGIQGVVCGLWCSHTHIYFEKSLYMIFWVRYAFLEVPRWQLPKALVTVRQLRWVYSRSWTAAEASIHFSSMLWFTLTANWSMGSSSFALKLQTQQGLKQRGIASAKIFFP